MTRGRLQRIAAVTGAAAVAAAAAIFWQDGFEVVVLGITLRANRIDRLLWLSSLSFALFFLTGGRVWRPATGTLAARLLSPHAMAIGLALITLAVSVAIGSKTVGGSDSYGYVSQAHAWLTMALSQPQPWVTDVPWSAGPQTFTPLGYRLGIDGTSLVPVYAAGFPLLMALAMLAGGACAAFLVVPAAAAIAVYCTYRLGRYAHSEWIGLAGAWLLASSPVFVEMALQPMSDVPSVAAWVLAFVAATRRTGWSSFASGIATAVAVLIRVNHAPLAAVLLAWFAEDAYRRRSSDRNSARHLLLYVLGLLPGVVALGLINTWLYGSPLSSGYGPFSYWFRLEHLLPNLQRYPLWLNEVQTPLVWIAVAGAFLPVRRLWPSDDARRLMIAAAMVVGYLIVQYLLYAVFDNWRYLRFFLAAFPFLALAGSRLAAELLRAVPAAIRNVLIAGALAGPVLANWSGGDYGWQLAAAQRYYATAGEAVRGFTEPSSVVFSMQHSGSVRFYGGRMTLRYDDLNPHDLTRTVAWLEERGLHPYALVEDWEVDVWRGRFVDARGPLALEHDPILSIEKGHVRLYDLQTLTIGIPREITPGDDDPHCGPPRPVTPLNGRR